MLDHDEVRHARQGIGVWLGLVEDEANGEEFRYSRRVLAGIGGRETDALDDLTAELFDATSWAALTVAIDSKPVLYDQEEDR